MYRQLLLIIVIMILGCFTGCGKEKYKVEPESYEFAVIMSTEYKKSSYIDYYQDSKLLWEKKLRLASMNDEDTLNREKQYIYVDSFGTKLDCNTTVVEINSETGKVREYETGQINTTAIAADENNVWAASNLNGEAKLVKIDKKTEEIETIYMEELSYISRICIYNGKVYVFCSNADNEATTCTMYVVDSDTMKVQEKSFNLSQYFISPENVLIVDDKIYMVSNAGRQIHGLEGVNTKSFVTFDIGTEQIGEVFLERENPEHIQRYGDWIIIGHEEKNMESLGYISCYNIKNGELKGFSIDCCIRQMEIKENYLYILDGYQKEIIKYEINPEAFGIKEQKRYSLKERKEGVYYYIGGFFVQ